MSNVTDKDRELAFALIEKCKIKQVWGYSFDYEKGAEMLAAHRESQWQPIATAPRDGTVILVNNVEGGGYCTDGEEFGTAYWSNRWFKDGAWISNGCCDNVSHYNPTHWKPVTPPKESKNNG